MGRNIFFTGVAGTGKSTLLSAIKHYLNGMGLVVDVMAPSSLAAANVGGRTLRSLFHSYAGWDGDIDAVSLEELCNRTRSNSSTSYRTTADVLVIDEGSMIDSNTLTRLSTVMQAAALNSDNDAGLAYQPFGGAQVIFCGDFYQLPPIRPMARCLWCGSETVTTENKSILLCEKHGEYGLHDQLAMSSPAWQACNFKAIELKKTHRHIDPAVVSYLNSCKSAEGLNLRGEEVHQLLLSHPSNVDRNKATLLCRRFGDAIAANKAKMNALPSQALKYRGLDSYLWQQKRHPALDGMQKRKGGDISNLLALKDHHLDFILDLKVGMMVLLMADLDHGEGLVKGRLGEVTGFIDMCAENQPLAASKPGDDGRRLAGQMIYGDHRHYKAREIQRFSEGQEAASRKWPVVRFINGKERVVFASCLVQELGTDKPFSLLSRTQIPLLPRWALTVFRSQGLTLDKVIVRLEGDSADGEAYVALSRTRCLEDMIVDALPQYSEFLKAIGVEMAKIFGREEPSKIEGGSVEGEDVEGEDVEGGDFEGEDVEMMDA